MMKILTKLLTWDRHLNADGNRILYENHIDSQLPSIHEHTDKGH